MFSNVAQFSEKVACRFVPLLRLLGQTAIDDPLQRRGQLFLQWRRILPHNRRHGFNAAGAQESFLSRSHLIHNQPK